jgi:cell division protein FtsZ
VIINITGGPDLTLTEVNEASEIIHGAAHEDANIIFGAVVDPTMEGKVKITVIATGFDRAKTAAAPASQASVPTPTDLHAYAVRAHEERLVVNGGISRVTLGRRAPIELPIAAAGASPAASEATVDAAAPDEDADDASPLDVPAFLRRQEA